MYVARAVGRGGSATSNLKRYDIGKVYHKSMAGGHPREALEATFDVVHEGNGIIHLVEAETIHVASQVMGSLPTRDARVTSNKQKVPIWYIRLNHTRLSDSILDLCGIPSTKEALRRVCLNILSRFTSPAPNVLSLQSEADHRGQYSAQAHQLENLDSILKDAVANHGMSLISSKRMSALIQLCLPLSPNIVSAIDTLQRAIAKVKSLDMGSAEQKRTKRFEDAAKSLRNVRDLISALETIGLKPFDDLQRESLHSATGRPLYISLDLGLHQRRKHYNGGTIFQCIALPDDFFQTYFPNEHHEVLISPSGRGIKIAEGGNYSELVRRNRPPGNFSSSVSSQYQITRIPVCAGVRFAIGKIVEMIYLSATLSRHSALLESGSDILHKTSTEKQSMEVFRQSLGHPLQFSSTIKVLVASVYGMDEASAPERFSVASRLWNEGIPAEYLPQSSVALSLVNRINREASDSTSSDWSLLELQGACALLRIPFIVIVQPHLLKDKSSVRLRQVPFDALPQGPSSSGGCSEILVTLDNLASTILGASPSRGTDSISEDAKIADNNSGPSFNSSSNTSSTRDLRSNRAARVECIFVDNDQYISSTREISKNETPHYKSALRNMKSVKFAAETYLVALQDPVSHAEIGLSEGIPVFAVTEVSFFVLRDFGTALMRRERMDQSSSGACAEMMERYPKHKRVLKTLSAAIDNLMIQRYSLWNGGSNNNDSNFGNSNSSSTLVTVLLYSKVDDRFDVITLNANNRSKGRNPGHSATNKRR